MGCSILEKILAKNKAEDINQNHMIKGDGSYDKLNNKNSINQNNYFNENNNEIRQQNVINNQLINKIESNNSEKEEDKEDNIIPFNAKNEQKESEEKSLNKKKTKKKTGKKQKSKNNSNKENEEKEAVVEVIEKNKLSLNNKKDESKNSEKEYSNKKNELDKIIIDIDKSKEELKKLNEAKNEINNLNKELEESNRKNEIKKKEDSQKIEELKKEIEKLEKEISNLKQSKLQLEQLNEKLNKKNEEYINNKNEELNKNNNDLKKLNEEYINKKNELNKIKNDINELKEELKKMNQTKIELTKSNQVLQAKLDELTSKKNVIEKIDKELKQKEDELKTYINNIEKSKKELLKYEEQYTQKKIEIKKLESEYEKKVESLTQKEKQIIIKNKELIFKENELNKKFKELTEKNTPILIGLNNIGATCYMNASLQCLSNTKKLTDYFLKHYKYNPNQLMSNEYYEVLKNLWNKDNNNKSYSPNSFKDVLSKLNPLFAGIAANDSKDLINFLLERFHQELNKVNKIIDDNNEISMLDQTNEQSMLKLFLEEFKQKFNSPISNLMYGILETKTQCQGCNIIKFNFQIYSFLEFPLQKVNEFFFNKGKRPLFTMNGKNPDIDLYECFEYYQKIDLMTGDNQMYCNTCNKLCNSLYSTILYSGPNYLIINLNRGKGAVYECKVFFPEQLNLYNYVTFKNGITVYELYAVICHLGPSSMSGHFVAYCRNRMDNKWYLYNDAFVNLCTKPNQYNDGMPYILFYKALASGKDSEY